MSSLHLTNNERRESFIRWYAWSLKYGDCDPAVWMTNYLHKRYEHNDEERLWLAWLYGNTYQLPTAWVLKNEFPDYELATVSRITWWNSENYKRLRYQVDTKWNKGHLPAMFESYQKFIGKKTQREVLERYYGDNEKQTFDNLWNAIKNSLYKFGRYSTWFYLQHLRHTAAIHIQPTSLMLDDFSGSRSHRNGLHFAFGEDDNVDRRLTAGEYSSLESRASEIIVEMKDRFPELRDQIDFFTMETCLCSFRKIFRNHHTRFLGYYLARQKQEIEQAERDNWSGIEWNVLWQARKETLDRRLLNLSLTKENSSNSDYLKTGKIREPWEIFVDCDNLNNFFT
jgi:hypothetical protein